MKRRYRKKQRRMLLYIGAMLLLFVCVSLLAVQKPEATPEPEPEDRTLYENAWIVSAGENMLTFMAEGSLMQAEAEGVTNMNNTLADIELKNGKVQKIGVKRDTIGGRVLAVGEDFIEIEGYGKLPLSEHFAVYQIYGELVQIGRAHV